MSQTADPIADLLTDIEVAAVDADAIQRFEHEGDFVGIAVNLLIEAGSYLCVAANLYDGEKHYWDRDEAIIGGHLVRMFKLIDALLDQTCKNRLETSFSVARQLFECIVNTRYIIANASDETFRSYRLYSLQHELRLLKRIEENVQERCGEIEPIEERMMTSINRAFEVSGHTREEIEASRQRSWAGLNLYERAKTVGLGSAYLGIFGGGSHIIHGNWQDLLDHHLEEVGVGQYQANIDWHPPRPQIIEALVTLIIDAVIDYLDYFVGIERSERFVAQLENLRIRACILSEHHEAFLVAGQLGA